MRKLCPVAPTKGGLSSATPAAGPSSAAAASVPGPGPAVLAAPLPIPAPLLHEPLLLRFRRELRAREASPGALGVGASLGSEVGSGSSTGAPSAGGNLPAVAGGAFGGVFGTATEGLTRCGAPPALLAPTGPTASAGTLSLTCTARDTGSCPAPDGVLALAAQHLQVFPLRLGHTMCPQRRLIVPSWLDLRVPHPCGLRHTPPRRLPAESGLVMTPSSAGLGFLWKTAAPWRGHEQHAGRLVRLGSSTGSSSEVSSSSSSSSSYS